MPNPIPPLLLPCVSPAPEGSLTLLTSVLDAGSNWLLLRHIRAALIGSAISEQTRAADNVLSNSIGDVNRNHFKVIFVSILRGFEIWQEMGKKLGLDFPLLVGNKRLLYFNGLPDPTMSPNPPLRNADVVNFNLSNLPDLENLIRRYSDQGGGGGYSHKTILIMDGLDFLLASQPLTTSLTLSRTIMTLRRHVHSTIITASADYPLLHNSSSSATHLEREHRAFVTTMAHQSRIVIQLRSLGTGAAKDISGILRVSFGAQVNNSEHESGEFEEGEWLYQVKGDGTVKVWARGM